MKNRLKAILLATGLTLGMLGVPVTATERTTEAVTEAAQEAAGEASSEAAAPADTTPAAEGAKFADYYEDIKGMVPTTLQQLSDLTEEQLAEMIENVTDSSSKIMLINWQNVREELGAFKEVTEQEVTEEGDTVSVASKVLYDGVDDETTVVVNYDINMKEGTGSVTWDIQYTMGKLMTQAGLNTLMGLGIVFLTLLFLSFLISELHWIPDLLEKAAKKETPAPAAKAAPVPAPVAAAEEEDLTDDLELVAVITAAIAASEQAPADGFIVRTIRKANRRNWLNA